MAQDPKAGSSPWMVRLFAALAALAVAAWLFAGFVGCHHAGLV